MTYHYRRTLPDVPLDIVGDVHGEFAVFQTLLEHLGYRDDGFHPDGRKLVFVGDLCDRGPDSPAVLAWAERAVEAGYAFAVLGNHELNLLVCDAKDGSGWFFDRRADQDAANYAPWQRAKPHEKSGMKAWLEKQPLIWERDDIRVVHAAWLPDTFAKLDAAAGEGLVEQYRRFDEELKTALQNEHWYAGYLYEQEHYAACAENAAQMPPPMPATARYDFARSRMHPIRALTSGVEQLSAKAFYAGGRWRGTERCPWWEDYREEIPVVIGHYWRAWRPSENPAAAGRNLFPVKPDAWHGAKRNVFCVDFSIGASWRVRKYPQKYAGAAFRLAALRWPEKILVADNGETLVMK
ncbi:metallophosphoesterase [Neisseria animalis]|uniref:Serine/threonine protein phosphatase n=1 Tax=Neisseria animalis TaxID=492 RepID=A0A5P3MS19_NEIAN|nr:metallophosphoesterase [Neisseria animalis]QEY24328.1 serine/threonine protein phosphatase [Neisseria animalis]ROW32271.1 serine/threonine protein phosphatase [Neisseria animalis]VEE06794.1 diadenosine tetraphosphatase [Neisseria animalis]